MRSGHCQRLTDIVEQLHRRLSAVMPILSTANRKTQPFTTTATDVRNKCGGKTDGGFNRFSLTVGRSRRLPKIDQHVHVIAAMLLELPYDDRPTAG